MSEDQLTALQKRILLPWQVQRGSTVWAPWGKSGWSAVDIKKAQRKWAKGMRVKPNTGKEVAQGKVPLDRLLKRDPKLKGKDRPGLSPTEVFAHRDEKKKEAPVEKKPDLDLEPPPPLVEPSAPAFYPDGITPDLRAPTKYWGTRHETREQRDARLNPPKWKHNMSPEALAEWEANRPSLSDLLDLLQDDSTDDDW